MWQWCEDEYKASMNGAELINEYPSMKQERESDGTPYGVLRGASWFNYGEHSLLSACRFNDRRTGRWDYYGFRCVLVISGD